MVRDNPVMCPDFVTIFEPTLPTALESGSYADTVGPNQSLTGPILDWY